MLFLKSQLLACERDEGKTELFNLLQGEGVGVEG